MRKRLLLLALLLGCLSSACKDSGTPEESVSSYLKAKAESDAPNEQKYQCWQEKEITKLPSQITKWEITKLPSQITKWKITKVEQKRDQSDRMGEYSLVWVRIESKSVAKLWAFDTWKSDEFFEHQKRRVDVFNRVLARSDDQVRQLTGKGKGPAPQRKIVAPKRETISSAPYCVLSVTEYETTE